MSFCDPEELVKGFPEKETEKEESKESLHDESIDIVINSLTMAEFEKELSNIKSNIVFVVNHLTDLDASQVFF